MRMVIVGAGVWVWPGIKLTNNDEETELIIFTKSEDIAYSSCAVPLVLGGNIKSFDDIIMHDAKHYLEKNIQLHLSTAVTALDSSNKTITFEKDSESENNNI